MRFAFAFAFTFALVSGCLDGRAPADSDVVEDEPDAGPQGVGFCTGLCDARATSYIVDWQEGAGGSVQLTCCECRDKKRAEHAPGGFKCTDDDGFDHVPDVIDDDDCLVCPGDDVSPGT